jgi:L-asparagine transporter-like permease
VPFTHSFLSYRILLGTFWRILFFYVFGVLAIGVLVPYDDISLKEALEDGAKGAAGSPWVVAIQNAGIQVLPHIINAVILTSAYAYSLPNRLYHILKSSPVGLAGTLLPTPAAATSTP